MNTTIIDFISNYGYLAVAILIAVENIFPPIPSEIILTFSGFLSISAHLNLGGLIIASTIGALVGAIVLYLLGKLISFEKLERLITGKWGKILHFKMEHLEKAQRFFERHGSSTAGMAKFPIKRFLIFTAGGSLIWNAVLIVVGRLAGASWERFSVLIEKYSFVLLAVVVLIGGSGYLIYRIKMKRSTK